MLNPARRDGTSDNEVAREALLAAGVAVKDSSTEFAVTHQKSMVIDERDRLHRIAQLGDARPDGDPRLCGRNDATRPKSRRWSGASMPIGTSSRSSPNPDSDLIWCPNNGRQRIADFIDGAKETLWLQNERYQDMVIIERLVRAVKRGVRVRIMSRALHKLKQQEDVRRRQRPAHRARCRRQGPHAAET